MTTSTTGWEIDPRGVNHPAHYNQHPSGVECIDLIRGLNFDIASAVKYVMRRGGKGDIHKDLDKALWYLRDFRYDENGELRGVRPDPGDIGHRVLWDMLIAREHVSQARDFYLAIARLDTAAAEHAVKALIELEVAT